VKGAKRLFPRVHAHRRAHEWLELLFLGLLHRGLAQSGSSSAKCGVSNDWKIFFQWLEKMRPDCPMIGKIFRRFTSDWKSFRGRVVGTKRTKRGTKEEADGMSDNYDNF
jgi:hypothetical protein